MRNIEEGRNMTILLHTGAAKEMCSQMLGLAADPKLTYEKVLSVLCIDYKRYAEWEDILPFYRNIWEDSVVL